MGTLSLATAMAYAPNFQKGMAAASSIFHILDRKPEISDSSEFNERMWVSWLLN
jgi:ATP-binding cassette subfamily B (MDR/TAP) protein 1